jgi:hypothetical protein
VTEWNAPNPESPLPPPPVAPPVAPPAAASEVVFDGTTHELAFQAPEGVYTEAAPAGTSRKKIAGVAAAFVLLAGGGATAFALRAANNGGGAATPDKAVRTMIESLQKGDLLGVVDTFPSNERTMARRFVDDWTAEAKRLGGMKTTATMDKVDSYTLKVDGLQTAEAPVTKDIVNVSLTAGKVSVSTKTGDLPFGSSLGGAFDAITGGDSDDTQQTETGTRTFNNTFDLADADSPIMITTMHDSEGWHPSLMFSAFDAARRDGDKPAPTAADAIAARGSDTPEAAVTDMLNAIGAQDAVRVVELLSPDEWPAAHTYGRTVVKKSEPDSYETVATFKDMTFETKTVKGGKKLIPTAVTIHSVPGPDNGDDPYDVKLTKKGADCVQIVDGQNDTDETHCASEVGKAIVGDASEGGDGNGIDPAMGEIATRMAKQLGELGVTVVQSNGKWYVSPIVTIGDSLLTMTSALTKDDVTKIGKFYTDAFAGFGSSDDTSFNPDPPTVATVALADDPTATGSAADGVAKDALEIAVGYAQDKYFENDSYAGVTAAALAPMLSDFNLVEGNVASANPLTLSVSPSATKWVAAAQSRSGTCFYLVDSSQVDTQYASVPAAPAGSCTAANVPSILSDYWN